MSALHAAAALFLLLNLVAGLVRIALGPTAMDRMIAAQLFGSTGVAILLLLSVATERASLVDVALVFALLALVAAVTFVQSVAPARKGRA